MSYKLDPRILSKLRAFAARRRKLIIVRGVAAALAMLLVTMLIVAALDYQFVLPDEVRWSLSGVAYLLVIIAEWRTCLRLLAHTPGPRKLARLIEHAEPKLREDLLSAVELGATSDERVIDSAQFRGLLQQDVAARMESMQVDRLLPVYLVRRYLAIASTIVIGVISAFIWTEFQLSTLMLRALLPGANVGRVSQTRVDILGPNPAEALVPFGDAVPLLVKISGAPAREAWLETFSKTDGRQIVKLSPLGQDQFSGAIQVGREDLEYRVRAGDAITRKYLLDAEPRPHVVTFAKTFRPPAYTKGAPRTVVDEAGDLVALEGTEIDLKLETNQPIKAAELRLEQGAKTAEVIPVSIGSDGKLSATISMKGSGSYRVHLVAAKSGFENKFSPEYELRAEPDVVPQIEIESPKQDLILPANDLVDIVAHASDDVGLARIEQHVRVNEGAWKKVQLRGESGLKAQVSHRWDLYDAGVKAGDSITTKLVAFDLKGNRGESRPLQVTVIAAGVEMKRMESLDALASFYDSLKSWRTSVEALAKAASEARQRFEQTDENDPQRAAAVASLTAAEVDFDRQHLETAGALATALRAAQAGHQGADLVTTGRVILQIEAGTLRSGKGATAIVAAQPSAPFARDLMREIDDAASRAAQKARGTEDGFKLVLNSEEADLLAENAQILQGEQERVAELAKASGDDEAKWSGLGGRLKVVLSEVKGLEQILNRLADRQVNGSDRARNLATELKKQRQAVEVPMTEKGMTKQLLQPTINLAQGLNGTGRNALEFRQDVAHRPIDLMRDARRDTGPTWRNLDKIVTELETVQNLNNLPEEIRGTMKTERWLMRRDLFKTHGDLEEIRPTSDAAFVADLRNATVALEGLQTLSATEPVADSREKILKISRAFRILESVHDMEEAYDGLGVLAVNERWQFAGPRARVGSPRDWKWLEDRLRQLPDELGKFELRDDATRSLIDKVQHVFWDLGRVAAFRELNEEMERRRKVDFLPTSRRGEADLVAAEVRRAIDLLRPQADAARLVIQEVTPKLSEYAKALAEAAEKLKTETNAQKNAAKEKAPEEAKAEAAKAIAEQKKINDRVESLKDLLRADANQQDMLKANDRERARDADDALAMLKEPPPKAENALRDAANAETPSARQDALAQAVEQQQKLQEALGQISQHYDAMEKGEKPDETRTAMRAAEQDLGIKEELDKQYTNAERIAQMALASPTELLKQLEKALPQNPAMQQELSGIAQNTLAAAEQQLQATANAEKETARNLDRLAQQQEKGSAPKNAQEAAAKAEQAAKEASEAAESARQSANEAVQAAKRANNQDAANQGRQARANAQDSAEAARRAIEAAQQLTAAAGQLRPESASEVKRAAEQTAVKSAEAAKDARIAAETAKLAQAQADKAAAQPNADANNQQASQNAKAAAEAAQHAAEAATQAQAAAEMAMAMRGANPAGEPSPGQPQPPAQAQANAQSAQSPANANQSASAQPQSPPTGQNPILTQAARQQTPIGQATAQAGADVARAGRHEERLQNRRAGEQLQQLGTEIGETATNEIAAAEAALAQAQKAGDARDPVTAAAKELASEASQISQAAHGNQMPAAGAEANPNGEAPAMAQNQDGSPSSNQAAADASGQPNSPGGNQKPASNQTAQSSSPNSPAPANPGQNRQPAIMTPQVPIPGFPNATQGSGPVSPPEQVWMARTLDALDQALNSPANSSNAASDQANGQQQSANANQEGQPANGQKPGQDGQAQQAQSGQKSNQPGQSDAMAQAQAAMNQAAQSAQNSMAQSRSESVAPTPNGTKPRGDRQAKSQSGALAQVGDLPYGTVPNTDGLKAGEWGKLPKQIAEQLSRGQGESVPAEYRNQVETYYRVIAERARKP